MPTPRKALPEPEVTKDGRCPRRQPLAENGTRNIAVDHDHRRPLIAQSKSGRRAGGSSAHDGDIDLPGVTRE